jgi:hypothetical protein
MPPIRFRIRTIMIAIAALAILMCVSRLEPLRTQPFLPACPFRLTEGAGFADRVGTAFFDAAFLVESAAVFFFAATFLVLEASAIAFGADFEVLACTALEEAFAPFGVLRVGIRSPTACMALDPALITTSAADVAASPIRSSTPLDFFLLGIKRSLRGYALCLVPLLQATQSIF